MLIRTNLLDYSNKDIIIVNEQCKTWQMSLSLNSSDLSYMPEFDAVAVRGLQDGT